MWKMLMIMLAALLASAAAPGVAQAQTIRFGGVVEEVRHESIVFHTDRGSVEVLVTHETRLVRNGQPARLADFQRGDRARVVAEQTNRGLIGISIEAWNTNLLHGVIARVGHDAILLRTDRGDVLIGVTERTVIIRDGRPARLADLQPGDRAGVEAIPDGRGGLVARTIHARSGVHLVRVSGVITEIGRGSFILHTDRGDVRVAVTERTRIMRNGEPVRFEDLQVRDGAIVQGQWEGMGHDRRLVAHSIAARGQ